MNHNKKLKYNQFSFTDQQLRRDFREAKMDIDELFDDEQKKALVFHGIGLLHALNHNPVAYIRLRALGFSFLLTEKSDDIPGHYFGLCNYDTKLEFGFVNFKNVRGGYSAIEEDLRFDNEFKANYPLAVYAKVANQLGTIVVDDTDKGYGDVFSKFIDKETCNPNVSLRQFIPSLKNFDKFSF